MIILVDTDQPPPQMVKLRKYWTQHYNAERYAGLTSRKRADLIERRIRAGKIPSPFTGPKMNPLFGSNLKSNHKGHKAC